MVQDGSKGDNNAKDKGDSGTIAVTVNYQQRAETYGFRPSTKIEEVLDWSIGKFGIDLGMAAEFELALHGIPGELPGTDNLGRLATGAKSLALDLVRGEIANGASA